MPTIKIPTPLRAYAAGQSEVAVQGGTVAEAISDLLVQFPALRPHLMSEDGRLRAFVNVFLGQNNVRDLDGMNTPLPPDAALRIIPSIAGGETSSDPRAESQKT